MTNEVFKEQTGAPTDSASAPAVTASENSNHHREQNNTSPRKALRRSTYVAQNKRTALLSEKTRSRILVDLKAGLGEQAIGISHGVLESQVRKVRKVHLSLEERVAAILHIAAGDIRQLTADTWKEEGAA